MTNDFDSDSGDVATLPPWIWAVLGGTALCVAAFALYRAAELRRRLGCAESYDEGRVAGAIAGAKAYAEGYGRAAP